MVVEAAMRDLTAWVYPRRGGARHWFKKSPQGLHPPKGPVELGHRAAAIHTFKHLKHHGHQFSPAEIHNWAIAHGWTDDDAQELEAYATGVLAGTRYHTSPDPFGRLRYDRWQAESVSR